MKRLFDPLFTGYCIVWLTVRAFRHIGEPLPLINGYLTDFVAVPVIAHIAIMFTRKVVLRNNYYTYPLSYLLFLAAYTSIVFEWIMPRYSSTYTSDIWDIVAYFAGALFYFFIHRPLFAKTKAGL